MKIQKNSKKSEINDPKREFYATLNEIKDLYQNHGFLKARSLYEEMKKIHNWKMSYVSFTLYFNKEIKNKELSPAPQGKVLDTKKNKIIDNNYHDKSTLKEDIVEDDNKLTQAKNRLDEILGDDSYIKAMEAQKEYEAKNPQLYKKDK